MNWRGGRTVECKECLKTLESSRLMKAFVLKMLKYFADSACFNNFEIFKRFF